MKTIPFIKLFFTVEYMWIGNKKKKKNVIYCEEANGKQEPFVILIQKTLEGQWTMWTSPVHSPKAMESAWTYLNDLSSVQRDQVFFKAFCWSQEAFNYCIFLISLWNKVRLKNKYGKKCLNMKPRTTRSAKRRVHIHFLWFTNSALVHEHEIRTSSLLWHVHIQKSSARWES